VGADDNKPNFAVVVVVVAAAAADDDDDDDWLSLSDGYDDMECEETICCISSTGLIDNCAVRWGLMNSGEGTIVNRFLFESSCCGDKETPLLHRDR
jgi:hypothetical protein